MPWLEALTRPNRTEETRTDAAEHGTPHEDGSVPRPEGGGGYEWASEALRDGQEAADGLAEVLTELRELNEAQRAEIKQTAKLRESVDRLTQAMEGLDRTVKALLEEVAAGRDGAEALAPVVVVRKAMADGAAEDAAAHAGAATKGLLQEVLEKLKGIGRWLWSMLVHLVKVRQWSFGGEVGIPGFAKASITVTLGDSGTFPCLTSRTTLVWGW